MVPLGMVPLGMVPLGIVPLGMVPPDLAQRMSPPQPAEAAERSAR
jgi:hypothetical protein